MDPASHPFQLNPSNLTTTHWSHLGHEAVGVGVLFILEDNVWIVVAHKFIEALRVACDLALCSPAGPEVVL